MVQVLTFLTFAPAKSILTFAPMTGIRTWVGGLPFVVQFVAIMFLTDLVQYWVHRAFHRVPWLWKFHAVHHSAQTMDWMAGARMHFLEIFLLRSFTVIPMYVLGFSDTAMHAYIFLVDLYSTFVHANLGWRLSLVERFQVTPQFHRPASEAEAVDVNCCPLSLLDKMFGTFFCRRTDGPAVMASRTPVPGYCGSSISFCASDVAVGSKLYNLAGVSQFIPAQ
jgi:sterol desaturase/sphingolipid hydroxylase (fatty acid hydroxylase superfamily)